jgi:hypothetical protein
MTIFAPDKTLPDGPSWAARLPWSASECESCVEFGTLVSHLREACAIAREVRAAGIVDQELRTNVARLLRHCGEEVKAKLASWQPSADALARQN